MFDNEEVRKMHGMSNGYNWLPDFVYGGIDGAVTTFAVVAGVEGANLSLGVLLILGFANLFADGFSMATGKYLSDKANREQYEKIRAIEYRHIKEKYDHERGEIVEIFESYGFKGKDLERATEIVVSNPDVWVEIMMKNEFNLSYEGIEPIKGAMATFWSFILVGFIPLLAYTFNPFFDFDPAQLFLMTSIFTLIALFIVGTVKSRFTMKNWFLSGVQTMFIGGLAAFIAYVVGYFLQTLK